MPMFQEHLEQEETTRNPAAPERTSKPTQPIPIQASIANMPAGLLRKLSEESIRTELCEGPLPDSPTKPATPEQDQDVSHTVSDRAELIERLKRGESPTWVPNRHLESLFHQHTPRSPTRSPRPPSGPSPTLLPAAEITPERERAAAPAEDGEVQERLQEGLTIERPRSALHSGNFTPEESPSESRGDRGTGGQAGVLGHFRTGSQPWLATSPPRDFATPFPSFDRHSYRREVFKSGASSLSSSLSSSFLYKPPTSPLVQSESNDDLDLALPMDNIDIATSSPRHVNGRRHTLHFSQSIPNAQPVFHRQAHYPYQAHQPRRSLTTTPNFSLGTSSPQTPGYLRSRRPSYSSEASPLQHASMVGSYEESILRGRMSTTPSKPLDFMAQIGVLGLGKCKPSLRCPPHVTLPFSAVFYSYSSTAHGRTKSEDGPSPYVGNIDLENGLANPEEEQRAKRKLQTRHPEMRPADDEMTMEDVSIVLSEVESRRTPKRKRRSRSPKAPPGGRYRLPEKGQLQIIIKNQNKTAVKLFLVPYDLSGMEPGTKTFIRQRSYSAGPIVDNVPGVPANTTVDAAADRPILRYLIHLHICCPSKGRFYLYKSIRVVFANRVPDGKEKLRNEVTYPEPRFSPYKPTRSMHPPPLPQGSGGPGAMLAAEQAFRRRSSGFSFANHLPASIRLEDMPMPSPSFGLGFANPGLPFGAPIDALPVDPIPFPILRKQIHSQGSDGSDVTMAPPQSSGSSDRTSRPPTQDSNSMSGLQWTTPDAERYDKLSKGDIGYGGNAFAPTANGTGGAGATEGLLSKRLRSLGVQGREGIRGGGGEMPKEEEHPSAA